MIFTQVGQVWIFDNPLIYPLNFTSFFT